MYRLMISFNKDEFKGCTWVKSKEYLLSSADDVCKVLTSLSHFDPIITCFQIPVLTADEVLKDFESIEV